MFNDAASQRTVSCISIFYSFLSLVSGLALAISSLYHIAPLSIQWMFIMTAKRQGLIDSSQLLVSGQFTVFLCMFNSGKGTSQNALAVVVTAALHI
jgi:hypothetical protein